LPKRLAREELKQYGLRLLAGRALSEGEFRTRLTRRAAHADDVDAVVESLREYGFVDDSRFAEHYASARRDSGIVGQQRVLRDLRQRRVSAPVAQQAVTDAFGNADEAAMVREWLGRKLRGKNLAEYLADDKHLASTYRKLRYAGFSSSAVTRVLRSYSSIASDLEDSDQETD
jgi:regulatory protein